MKKLILLTFFLVISCGEDDETTSVSNSISGKYCLGATTEVDLDESSLTLDVMGASVQVTPSVSDDGFTLSGEVNLGESSADFLITADLSNSVNQGSATISVGAPVSMNINGYVFSGECATDTVDESGVGANQLITQLPVDVGDIDNISYFRSAAGHDASDDFEDCRSMKHYIEPITKLNDTNNVYAPFDGVVISMTTEEGNNFSDDGKTNQRISIRPTANPAYEVTLYHVDVLSSLSLTVGTAVNAGDHLGYGRLVRINSDSSDTTPSASNDFDIQAKVLTPSGIRAISVFQLMEDTVFTSFNAFGSSVSDFIITKSQRDADALTCDGSQFTETGSLNSWILP